MSMQFDDSKLKGNDDDNVNGGVDKLSIGVVESY